MHQVFVILALAVSTNFGLCSADALSSLITANATMPTQVAYWPLTSWFGLRDASPNLIDGAFRGGGNPTTAAGPNSVANTAYKCIGSGSTASNATYFGWTSSQLNLGNSVSWTLSGWINFNGNNKGPILEFTNTGQSTYYYMHLWQDNTNSGDPTNILWASPGTFTGPMVSACSSMTTGWKYVGLGYDKTTNQYFAVCDTSIAMAALGQAPLSYSVLVAGCREYNGLYCTPSISFACVSLYLGTLTTGQLNTAKSMCGNYQALTCPSTCPTSCRASLTAVNGTVCAGGVCSAGWTGSSCSTPVCTPSCANSGTCTAPNVCACTSSYTGANCTTPVCAQTCNHGGTCTGVNVCTCTAQYTGSDCTTPVCTPVCANSGTCTAPNVCACTSSYTGANCTTPVCAQTCNHGGTCTGVNVCTCTAQYTGSDCTTPVCTPACANSGTCTAPDVCACTASYTGANCTTPVCAQTCNHGGTCTGVNVCTCTAQYTGSDCTTPICTSPCQNGGSCTAPDTCSCNASYTGGTCQTPVCSPACLNGGNCTMSHACSCPTGYSGSICQANLAQLRTLVNGLPAVVGYWPLSAQFGFRDAGPNSIDGAYVNAVPALVTGPFGLAQTAYKTGWATSGASKSYISYSSALLDFGSSSSSWTISTFLYTSGATWGPILDYSVTGTYKTHLFINSGTEFYLNSMNPSATCSGPCTAANAWQFVAGIYDNTNGREFMFCNETFSSNCSANLPFTSTTLNAGYRVYTTDIAMTFSFACTSIYSTALSTAQLLQIKQLCALYQAITCSSNCAADTCRASAAATNGYTCSSCVAGWTSSDCTVPFCSPACQNGATCSAPNTCTCAIGYNGTYCESPICSQACANSGTCTAPNTCSCTSSYTGANCTTPVCSPTCNNGGTCSSPNVCNCTSQYNGTDCTIPVCNPSCQNGGTCSSPGVCNCTTSYNGTDCSIPVCSPSCQHGGTCNSPNACSCISSWTGGSCNIPICTPACANSGTCIDVNVCSCTASYTGANCTTPVCNPSCTNGGTCTDVNVCTCPANFTGPGCASPVCTPDCSNGGTCAAPNTCTCPATYTGSTCTIPVCSPACTHGGTCIGVNICSCPANFTGNDCSTPVCDPPCQHGSTCSAPNVCTCTSGYMGSVCDTAVCSPACAHGGTCSAPPDTCTCTAQWNGTGCATPVCNPFCQNGGTCSAPGTCDCVSPLWTGVRCETPICANPCRNSGVCSSPNTCSCTPWYTGPTCIIPVCNPSCENGGTCSAVDTCTCTSSYMGPTCTTPICTPICENGGTCTAPNVCSCTSSWQGSLCTTPVCNPACDHGGTCVAPNSCTCISSWNGTFCTIPVCSTPCQHGGTCSDPDTCTCGSGWEGSICTTPICTEPCSHGGTCTTPDRCSCTSQWSDDHCTTPVCSTPCQHGGTCVDPDTCSCIPSWTGANCEIPVCSPPCANNGTCTSPNVCLCTPVWTDDLCTTPVCTFRCENGGSCTGPDTCTCTEGWKGTSCGLPLCYPECTEMVSVQTDPFAIDFLRNVSDSAIAANVTKVGEMALATSISIVNQATPDTIVPLAINFMEDLADQLERYSEMAGSFPPEMLTNLSQVFASAADVVMAAVTNGTESESDDVDMSDNSVKCVMSKSSGSGDEAPALLPTVHTTPDQLEKLYSKFTKLLKIMVNMVKSVLYAGTDFSYGGSFFAVAITNLEMRKLPGLELKTSLATMKLPDANDTSHILTNYDPFVIKPTTTVSASVIAYIANVLDTKQPFNMPTITAAIMVGKRKLMLNRAQQIKVVGMPVVKKKMLFSTQKVDAQCDISKVKCDLANNADQIGSVVRFPVKRTAGDFMLIFPVIPFNYVAYVSLNSTPKPGDYIWRINVTANDAVANPTPAYPTLRLNYNKQVELRALVPQNAIIQFADNATLYGASPNASIYLYIFMKRNLSQFADQDIMPQGACDLQRCFGYHLRVGPAASTNTLVLGKRKKRDVGDEDDEEFELDPGSTEGAVAFTSNYFGDFGAELVIMPNTIEFSNVFANFATLLADNNAVFSVQIAAVAFFLIGVVFAVRFDRFDLKEWAFLPIISNRRDQPEKYLISITHYGVKCYEQKPMVWIRLIGFLHDTDWRLLEDNQRKNFTGKRPANFCLGAYIQVGRLEAIEIMVNALKKPTERGKLFQMHVEKVTVVDVNKGRKYVFLVKAKLRAGEMKRAELATEDEIKGFRYLVSSHSRIGISETHPWVSTAYRPLPSNWTRAERLGCVVSALFMAMLVNAMFYGQESSSPKVGIKVGGFFRISWFTIWTSMVGSVIIIPPTSVMAFIFKHIKRRTGEKSKFATIFNIKLPEHVDEDDEEEEGGKKKKKPFMLPFQCVIIAWFLVAACVGTSAFFVIMYSLTWGSEKSLQWLTSMVLHIIQDIIIVQTVKVALVSIFSSTFLNLPDDGLNIGKMTYKRRNFKRPRTELFSQTRNMMGAIIHHLIYVLAFVLVVWTAHNSYSFRQVNDLRPLVSVGSYQPVSAVINDYSEIYSWLNDTLLPNFLTGNQIAYGGKFSASKMYKVINHDVVLMGPIRIRQQRTARNDCPLQASVVPSHLQRYADGLANKSVFFCQKSYSDDLGVGESSEKRSFNSSWLILSTLQPLSPKELANLSTSQGPWTYRETDGPPYFGWQANYQSGGYYVDLPSRLSSAQAVVTTLWQNRWLDNSTSVLFIDFVLYNAQINVFVSVKVVFEAMSAGGMAHHKWLYPLNLYQYSGDNAMLAYAVQALWILVLISHVIKLVILMKRKGCYAFCNDSWNLFDLAQILLSLCIVGLFGARIYAIIGAITQMQTGHRSFTNFDLLVNWEDLMLNLYGIALFMTMMMFFRHLTSNKFWAMFLGTLSHGRNDLTGFVFLFTLITLMFAGLGYGTLGATCDEFRTFSASFMTLVQNIIGVVGPLISLAQTSRFIMVFVLAYSSIVMFLAVQIFMAIVSSVYGDVASDVEEKTIWDADLSNYIYQEWKSLFQKKNQKRPSKQFFQNDSDEEHFEPVGENALAKLEHVTHCLSKAVVQQVEKDLKEARSLWAYTTDKGCQWLSQITDRRPVEKSARCISSSLNMRATEREASPPLFVTADPLTNPWSGAMRDGVRTQLTSASSFRQAEALHAAVPHEVVITDIVGKPVVTSKPPLPQKKEKGPQKNDPLRPVFLGDVVEAPAKCVKPEKTVSEKVCPVFIGDVEEPTNAKPKNVKPKEKTKSDGVRPVILGDVVEPSTVKTKDVKPDNETRKSKDDGAIRPVILGDVIEPSEKQKVGGNRLKSTIPK